MLAVFTALASQEQGNVIARVCMSVCVSQNVQQILIHPDAVICMVCNVEHKMLFALYLTLPWYFDDSNLLHSDISRGDEMKLN
jgi:hypothetical protein